MRAWIQPFLVWAQKKSSHSWGLGSALSLAHAHRTTRTRIISCIFSHISSYFLFLSHFLHFLYFHWPHKITLEKITSCTLFLSLILICISHAKYLSSFALKYMSTLSLVLVVPWFPCQIHIGWWSLFLNPLNNPRVRFAKIFFASMMSDIPRKREERARK